MDSLTMPIQYYLAMFGVESIAELTFETNRNLMKAGANTSRLVSDEEMAKFLGIVMYTSLVHIPRMTNYWNKLLGLVVVPGAMPRNRFQVILQILISIPVQHFLSVHSYVTR